MRSTLRPFGYWFPGISILIKSVSSLQAAEDWSLIQVCSRDQAAIQIDIYPLGATTPRMSVIVWLLFFEPEPSLERSIYLTSSYSLGWDK